MGLLLVLHVFISAGVKKQLGIKIQPLLTIIVYANKSSPSNSQQQFHPIVTETL